MLRICFTTGKEGNADCLTLIHKYCGDTLEELSWIDELKMVNDFQIFDENELQFAKLKKLKLKGHVVQAFNRSTFNYHFCPNLNHLEFKCFAVSMTETVDFRNVFDNLTIIRFDRYNRDALT